MVPQGGSSIGAAPKQEQSLLGHGASQPNPRKAERSVRVGEVLGPVRG